MAAKTNQKTPIYNLPNAKTGLSGFLWLNVLIGLAGIVLVSGIATQYLAWRLAFQPALGEPLAQIGGMPLYQPFRWVVWGWRYSDIEDSYLKTVLSHVYYFVTAAAGGSVLFAAYLNYRQSRKNEDGNEHLHGSAHWADEKEVKATGLLDGGQGVYVGGWVDPQGKVRYLRHNGPEHIMAFAPTRSGKGVGLVLPTLLSWPHSTVVYDIKGENWALTAGWRGQEANNICLKFQPNSTDGSSIKINALAEVRAGTDHDVSDVQNIAMMVIDYDGRGLESHWDKTGYAFLVSLILHVIYAEPDKSLPGVARFFLNSGRTLEETLEYMLNSEHDPEHQRGWLDADGNPTGVHPAVAAGARSMLNKADEERSGVASTAESFLDLYRDPIVAKNISESEFRISDLMNADRPVSLYIVVSPEDKDRLKPLTRLLLTQIVRRLTEKMEFKGGRSVAGYKHRLLLLIDEFPSLGKLAVFEEAMAFIAGYGMKAYLIIQDAPQLWKAYGKDEAIFSNCHVRIAYAPNKIETAEMLSKMTGTTTIVKAKNSFSGDRLGPVLGNVSTSIDEVSRPLLTPDEVMRLPLPVKDEKGLIVTPGDMLVFVAGHAPIYGRQIVHGLDPVFNARAQIEPPTHSDRLVTYKPDAPLPLAVVAGVAPATQPKETFVEAFEEAPIDLSSSDVAIEGIEYAPDDLSDPDDHTMAPAASGQKPDGLLDELKDLSANVGDDDIFRMFDDILEPEATAATPKEKTAIPAVTPPPEADDLYTSMADVLAEVANETRQTEREKS